MSWVHDLQSGFSSFFGADTREDRERLEAEGIIVAISSAPARLGVLGILGGFLTWRWASLVLTKESLRIHRGRLSYLWVHFDDPSLLKVEISAEDNRLKVHAPPRTGFAGHARYAWVWVQLSTSQAATVCHIVQRHQRIAQGESVEHAFAAYPVPDELSRR